MIEKEIYKQGFKDGTERAFSKVLNKLSFMKDPYFKAVIETRDTNLNDNAQIKLDELNRAGDEISKLAIEVQGTLDED